MIAKRIQDITLSDIESLRDNAVAEGSTLDYKLILPDTGIENKKEFLRDVTSFVNTQGGDLIFGVVEEQGVITEIVGCDISNLDTEIQRLENLLRDGIEPNISGHYFRPIEIEPGHYVIILRVLDSWLKPHWVKFKLSPAFYARNNIGKYPIELPELRSMFLLSETQREKLQQFRAERLNAIVARNTSIPLPGGPRFVLHTLPLSMIHNPYQLDPHEAAKNLDLLRPPYTHVIHRSFNLEGFVGYRRQLSYNDPEQGKTLSGAIYLGYVQAFRSAALETVTLELFDHQAQMIFSEFEQVTIDSLRNHLELLQKVNISPPYVVMLSFVGVRGYGVFSKQPAARPTHSPAEKQPEWFSGSLTVRINRSVLAVPEVFIEKSADTNVLAEALRPAFDVVWQACGYSGSMSYDATGLWHSPSPIEES